MEFGFGRSQLHVGHEIFSFLDGTLEFSQSFRHKFLLERRELPQAQVLLNAIFLKHTE